MANGLGLGLAGGSTGAGLFQGLAEWMRNRMTQQAFQAEMQDRDRRIAHEDRALEGQAAGQTQLQAFVRQIQESDLPPMQKLAQIINVTQGKGLSLPEPKQPRVQIAPSGEIVNLDDPENIGRTVAAQERPRTPQTEIVETPDGQVLINSETGEEVKRFGPRPVREGTPAKDRVIKFDTVDERGNPITRFLPESDVRGQTFAKPASGAGAVLPAALRQAQVDAQVSLRLLQDLRGMMKPELIGPMAGRVNAASLNVPGMRVSPDFARFSAATSRLRNATIKAITGAAMSESEAKRIMTEIPSETDKPEVWLAKWQQSITNLNNLLDIIARQGGGQPSATPTADPSADPLGIR